MLGGRVERGHGTAEFGRAYVTPGDDALDLLDGWFAEDREQVWMSHGDHVAAIAPGFEVYGTSPGAPFAITADTKRNGSTPSSSTPRCTTPPWARSSTRTSCASRASPATGQWAPTATRRCEKIRAQVGNAKVICALSGGVDSSVAAALIHEAIGDQLTCVFVDHGLLRQNEAQEVVAMFRDHMNLPRDPRR